MPTVADQQKKQLSADSTVGCGSHQPSRGKRKNLESTQCGQNMRSHISLNWDANKRRVVAKREQIAINWRDLSPFINSVPHCPKILADILAIPPEIFELESLAEVLSFEVTVSRAMFYCFELQNLFLKHLLILHGMCKN